MEGDGPEARQVEVDDPVLGIAVQVVAELVVVGEVALDSSLRLDHQGVDVVLAVDLVGAHYEAGEVV